VGNVKHEPVEQAVEEGKDEQSGTGVGNVKTEPVEQAGEEGKDEQSGTGVGNVKTEPVEQAGEEGKDEQSGAARGGFASYLSSFLRYQDPPRNASSNYTEPKKAVVIDCSETGEIKSVTESTTTLSQDGDVQIVATKRTLTPVNAADYCKMHYLLHTNVTDIKKQDDSENTVARTGFYATHKWTHFIRQKMAESEIYTEIHQFLEKFTDSTDLKHTDIFRICNEFHEGVLSEMPKNDDIRVLSMGLRNVLKAKYPELEHQREVINQRARLTRRQVQIEANREI